MNKMFLGVRMILRTAHEVAWNDTTSWTAVY